jgi:cation diffusion facilitator CzcD-associated flavoprotein CzcO
MEKTEHFDVVVIGAGISGIGAAYHLAQQTPRTRFLVLEALDDFGGTWLTHRYPGIRTDSELYTYGYSFKPWKNAPIAPAAEIRRYLGEVIEENHLAAHIRYGHTIKSAHWSSVDQCWTLSGVRTDTGDTVRFTAQFLWMCSGYYRQSHGYTPDWAGMSQFQGRIVHTETWPEGLDCQDKNVVVIGSGASAATVVPAIADTSRHVTMLQRSPTYFNAYNNRSELANMLRELEIDESWVHEIIRRKVLKEQEAFIARTFTEPDVVREELIGAVRRNLHPDYDVETHFTPSYRPWRQRVAIVPDGDLFKAIREGKVSVVTDQIERFVESGLLLRSGKTLAADIIVTATGFNLNVMGDIAFSVDGEPLVFADTVTYHGMMFTGIPNLAWTFGYLRQSWTLRVDLVADFVCRLLNHMRRIGAASVVLQVPALHSQMALTPFIGNENFNPGYMARGLHLWPKSGASLPWRHSQDYATDAAAFPAIDLANEIFRYASMPQSGDDTDEADLSSIARAGEASG